MALSENVNHLVHIVDNDLISIGTLNTDDSEAIESTLSHRPLQKREGTGASFLY